MTDERISYSGGTTSYRVEIKSFANKMNKWNPGREVRCKYFWHDDIKLRLIVNPNGNDEESKGFVSVFLCNESDQDIWIDGEIKLAETIERFTAGSSDDFKADDCWGPLTFFDHDKLDLMDSTDDDSLAITVTIRKVWKTFDEGKLNNQSISQGVKKIQGKITDLMHSNTKLECEMNSVLSRLQKLETRFPQVEDQREGASASNWTNISQADRGLMIPKPECPVCFEEMDTETKIAQCYSGHYLCWGCKANIQECPSCKLPVDGRAIGMEHYIKTLFK